MSTIDEIKVAIEKLTLPERAQLEKWLHHWEDDDWDRQIANDANVGRFDELLSKVDAEIDSGNLRDIP